MNTFFDDWLRGAALHLWATTLFGLAIGLFMVLFPGPARLRQLAGWLALLRFMLPAGLLAPLVEMLPWASAAGALRTTAFDTLSMPAIVGLRDSPGISLSALHLPGPAVLFVVWSAGTLAVLSLGIIRVARGISAVRSQEVPFSVRDREHLKALAARVGLAPNRVSGYYVSSNGWLGVVGPFRSKILFPEGLFSALDQSEADSVLLHELVHVKRHDNLLRLCQAGVVAIFWFHPLVWWLNRRLRWESERACDEEVLRLTGANRIYATGLFKAMRYALGLNLPGVSGMSRIRLQTRIRAVLNHQNRKDSPVRLGMTISALIGLLGLATVWAAPPANSIGTPAPGTQGKVSETAGERDNGISSPASNPKSSADKVWTIKELDQIPVIRRHVNPVYPAALKETRTEGEVVMSCLVDQEGNVGDVKVESSTDHRFDQASTDAVRQWKFRPGVKDGRPVKVVMPCTCLFSFSE